MNMNRKMAPLLRVWVMVAVLLSVAGGAAGTVRAQDGEGNGQGSGACGDPATLIHAIQGDGMRTPIGGDEVTVEAVVVGDYQESDELEGFFLQEEDSDADDEPATSEGIFVDSRVLQEDVQVGDVVRVTGTAFDVSDSGQTRTQLNRVSQGAITFCGTGAEVTPVPVELPLAAAELWERYEGMLIEIDEELTVTQLYNLGRYGEVQVAAGGRLYQPTNMARPGDAADTVAAENAARSFYLDDASSLQNVDPTYYPAGGLSESNILRSGYTVDGVVGIFDQRYGNYRLYALEPPQFQATNPRPTAPVISGRVTVASFNVLNYFNGDGSGDGFPTERGADTAEEFARQQAKIVAALADLEADIIGLMEIENDGDGTDSAIADLTNALNVASGEQVYEYIRDPVGLRLPNAGGDAIKQAIIYNSFTVLPVGDAVATLDAPFDQRRPPVVQTFEEIESGEQVIVGVNHFKSKGSCPGSGENADQGDSQGCWNAERVQAARTLADWLEGDPTGTGESDVLLIGDFNAYTMEDPMVAFEDTGYVNLVPLFQGEDVYSYVYYGMAGALDHAVASESLVPQVEDALIWHINADEPRAFDYNTEYKSENQVETFYEPGPYRSSDHDPVIVGLNLGWDSPAEFDATPLPTSTPEATPTPEATATPEATPTGEPVEEATAAPTDETTDDSDAPPDDETSDEPTEEEPAADGGDADGGDEDLGDATGGLIAIVGGAVALLLAIGAAFVGRMRS